MANEVKTKDDQYTFCDRVNRFPSIKPPKQKQSEPGLDRDLEPTPDIGEDSYRGTGRLAGRKALVRHVLPQDSLPQAERKPSCSNISTLPRNSLASS